ncbi:ATP-binding protein [Gaetbulibacter sp. M240]|uniref:ATP-binding protein n=1 Tax=Gaetbulibacter sp. M240 TaxID=3126511 RepID=UPI00374F0A15
MKNKEKSLLKLSNILLISMTIAIICATFFLIALIQSGKNEGFLINTSGKQRYLSQKLTKTSILFLYSTDPVEITKYRADLEDDLALFKANNEILLEDTKTPVISEALMKLQPQFNMLVDRVQTIISSKNCDHCLEDMLGVESEFLANMNALVLQYQNRTENEIRLFSYIILGSNIILMLLLIYVVIRILRPAIIKNRENTNIITNQNTTLHKLNADKDTIIGLLAHDLRGPLSGIIAVSDLFIENIQEYDKEIIQEQLVYMNKTTRKTYELLEEILMWANLQSNNLKVTPEQINFKAVTSNVLETVSQRANQKDINIQVSEEEPLEFKSDVNMFKAVIRNLVSNAIKFTHTKGQINIYGSKVGEEAIITVSDNGVGIDKDILPRLWQIKDIYTSNGTDNETGTGFGLKLCKEFVEKLGGRIWVESELGKGSQFKFTMPLNNDLA